MKLEIGKIPEHMPEGYRDAAHVPVVVARSYSQLVPGQRVRLDLSGTECTPWNDGDYHGVVDPFLEGPVPERSLVNVFVKPSLVESFRHMFDIDGVYEQDPDDGWGGCRGCY